jgi:hypothetical protein
MIDFIITFIAFFLTFQITATALRFLLGFKWFSNFFTGSRGLYLTIAPTFVGIGIAGLSIFPHLFGTLNGSGHIPSAAHDGQGESLPYWLVGLLALVALRFLIRLVAEARIGIHIQQNGVTPDSQALAKISEALETKGAAKTIAPRIHFHTSKRFFEPFLRGLFRPTIYLHVDLVETLSIDHLRAALFHEIGHQRRADHLVMALYSLFLSPIGPGRAIRGGYDEWVESSERKCDAIASQFTGSARIVAEALVAVVKFSSDKHAPTTSPALCGHRAIKQRVAKLISSDLDVDQDPIDTRHLLRAGFSLIGACLFFSLVAPNYGLELYCFFEQLVGTHCVG